MKLTTKIFITVWIVVLGYGFLCPYLISAKDSSLVLSGFMVLFAVTALLIWWLKKYIKILFEKIKEYFND